MYVLFPTDGRPAAKAAEQLLGSVADPSRVEVTVLHVDEYGNQLVADRTAETVIEESLAYLRNEGFEAAPKRADGAVKHAIERELDERDYGLILMGVGNTGWLGRLILGGVSTFVLHRSTVPTLVVHQAPIEGHDRVRFIVGVDGSPAADRAMETLIRVARPERCDVFVLSVVDPLVLPPAPGIAAMAIPPDLISRDLAEKAEDARRTVDAARKLFEDADFQCESDVIEGFPEVALMDAIQERDAEVVVVGSRGLGRFAGVALGSVSAHLVRTAPATLVAQDADPPSDDST